MTIYGTHPAEHSGGLLWRHHPPGNPSRRLSDRAQAYAAWMALASCPARRGGSAVMSARAIERKRAVERRAIVKAPGVRVD